MSETAMLTVDAGCSGTKVILRQRESTPKLLIMSPEVIEVTRESIDFYLSKNGITVSAPENEAWVEYDGTIYAVGFLAQEYFKARVALKDTKYEWAIAKVLAAVGVMVAREGIEGECDFAISIPLPYGEWEARHEFERDLRSALSCFSFRDKQLKARLVMFICVPEGGGHAMMLGEKMGYAFRQEKILSLMWGYRDISLVLFNRGAISGITELLGFYQLIEMVTNRTFGQSSREREQMLLEAIHLAGKDIKTKNFRHLVRSRHPEHKAKEAEQITSATRICRAEYWAIVARLLTANIPSDINAIVLGGGAVDYYAQELQNFLVQNYPGARISWAAELQEDVRLTFNLSPTSKEDRILCARLTDPYGLSIFTKRQVSPYSLPAVSS